MDLLIKNGTVINAGGRFEADVAVNGGKITETGINIIPGAKTEIVDASGLLVLPGAIDAHTHFELPFGDISSADDFASGTAAAACGGTTTVIDFVSPGRGESLLDAFEKRKSIAEKKVCIDYGLHMCIVEVNDRIFDEMIDCVKIGISSFKVFMTYASRLTDEEIKRTLCQAKQCGAIVTVHAEDHETLENLRKNFKKEGKTDAWHHYLSRDEAVEAAAVNRAVDLAKTTGAALYIVHLACLQGLKTVRQAQSEGYPVYAETCPQYLNFTCDVFKRPDGRNFVCSPPMKGKESRDALWQSIEKEFGINTIATDHCPFHSYEKDRGKNDFTKIPNGVMGVENMYPYMLSQANKGRLSFERVVELCSSNPAKIFGCESRKGMIAAGRDADIVIYDPKKAFTVTQKNMHSNTDYTIWEDIKLKGYPVKTYARGMLVYNDDVFTGSPGHGRFITRNRFRVAE